MRVGQRVIYIGETLMKPWLPRGTEGVVIDVMPGLPYPITCDFEVPDGDGWPMEEGDLEAAS